jgi:O-acetyl-ADP-ribose deacetylase (regulator of RNase III)
MSATNVIYNEDDLFLTELPAIGQGVNTEGLMGAGVAKAIRNRFPEIFEPYAKACKSGELVAGGMLATARDDGGWVLNLASQDLPGAHAKLEWFESSLRLAFDFAVEHELSGFAIPRIGAGIGGLKWEDVDVLVQSIAEDYPAVTLEVWTPKN